MTVSSPSYIFFCSYVYLHVLTEFFICIIVLNESLSLLMAIAMISAITF